MVRINPSPVEKIETSAPLTIRKKLIEVSLPLPEINDASAYDKMPGIGPHPKGIHQWWARLPLPTARAILFASLVDDPEAHPELWPTDEAQNRERERLFDIIRRLMTKKIHEHPDVFVEAHSEILKHSNGIPPMVLDPFSGGGSIPLEAQRLGLRAQANDLNPIAVLINKSLLEIAPRWANCSPVHPMLRDNRMLGNSWIGAKGLGEDVQQYANAILSKAREKLSPLYPRGPQGREAVAWLWCRTVASPDPARHGAHVPLIRSFKIGKRGSNPIWLSPVVDRDANHWHFDISESKPNTTATIGRRGGTCLIGGTPITLDYVRDEGKANRLGLRLVAIIGSGREYFSAKEWPHHPSCPKVSEEIVSEAMPYNPFAVRPPLYGFMRFRDVFTERQLYSLEIISDLVRNERQQILADAKSHLSTVDANAYADAVMTFLAFIVDRCVDFNNSLCRWSSSNQKVMSTFGRQAIPMIWDFGEANLLGESVGSWSACSDYVARCIRIALIGSHLPGQVRQGDASQSAVALPALVVSTDPPYYNNVDYSDLSDFFYVWLRRTIGDIYPDLFKTVLTPKSKELVASPYRFEGNKVLARNHFESGFRQVFSGLKSRLDPRFPMTVYYAFKQADDSDEETEDDESPIDTTTGWETLLEALIGSGFQITATWPVRASQKWRQMSIGMNSLASYIVLACRTRPSEAKETDRRSFVSELKRKLPESLRHLQQGNIAPVDFAQAAIGPGMAIYSQYSRILESSGAPMGVRTALSLINQTLNEVLSEQGDDFDSYTRWAIAWFEQHGFEEGDFGDAELLSKAKVASVHGLQQAGIVRSKGGKVKLLRLDELETDWPPDNRQQLTGWEMVHHLARALQIGGEAASAALLGRLGNGADATRELAYLLFNLCERKRRTADALAYNSLVQSWTEIQRLARDQRANSLPAQQSRMFT